MIRKILRSRVAFFVTSWVIFLGAVSVVAPVSASAAQGTHTETAATSGPEFKNLYNHLCLDGREGPGSVTLRICGSDGTHTDWTGNGSWLVNNYNGECLDGREGLGNVTVQACVPNDPNEEWFTVIFTGSQGFYLLNNDNGLCLDGREGANNVTMQTCETDGAHEQWANVG